MLPGNFKSRSSSPGLDLGKSSSLGPDTELDSVEQFKSASSQESMIKMAASAEITKTTDLASSTYLSTTSCYSLTSTFDRLHPFLAVNMAVVLEELSDRLVVLGKNIPAPLLDLRTDSSLQFDKSHRPTMQHWNKSVSSTLGNRWILRQRYDTILPRRIGQIDQPMISPRQNSDDVISNLSPWFQTASGKVELSRAFTKETMDRTVAELVKEFSFKSLIEAVNKERKVIADEEALISDCWRNKSQIRRLKSAVKDVGQEILTENQKFRISMWSLQDNLQEHNFRCDLENKYTAHSCEMRHAKSKKFCFTQENKLVDQVEGMKLRFSTEHMVHNSMLEILNKMKSDAESMLDSWVDKYETDKDHLNRSLDALKADRSACLDRIDWLKDMIANYKPIVKDDRRIKKIEADRVARLELMNKRATRIQAWWRGTMVRNGLGPFKPGKTGKEGKPGKTGDKKGKGKGKGKGKKKK